MGNPTNMDTDLAESTEEVFGGGGELPTTAFLVFGLLTFWIYTVWHWSQIWSNHLTIRKAYFWLLLNQADLSANNLATFRDLESKGFIFKGHTKYLVTVLYLTSMVLMIWLLGFKYVTGDLRYRLDLVVVGTAALLFCLATIYFLWSACRSVRNHEYYELLALKMVQEGDSFAVVPPSGTFVRRWNGNQSRIALFLILSIPMIISPVIGVQHFYSVLEAHTSWMDLAAFGWIFLLLVIAAIFHLWGTHLLLAMYNGHLRIEALNREQYAGVSKWAGEPLKSVLRDPVERPDTESSARPTPERTLAAIMITDMVDFSKEMEAGEESAFDKLLKHNEIIRENIEKFAGEEIKSMGDAFLVRFKSAIDAVKAAMHIQNDFARYNSGRAEIERIWVRIGVHVGDVLLMGRDIIGNGVNVAARIEPLAEPGGICISADTYNVVRKSIDIKVLSLGRRDLKNITDVPEIYKIIADSI